MVPLDLAKHLLGFNTIHFTQKDLIRFYNLSIFMFSFKLLWSNNLWLRFRNPPSFIFSLKLLWFKNWRLECEGGTAPIEQKYFHVNTFDHYAKMLSWKPINDSCDKMQFKTIIWLIKMIVHSLILINWNSSLTLYVSLFFIVVLIDRKACCNYQNYELVLLSTDFVLKITQFSWLVVAFQTFNEKCLRLFQGRT